MWIVVIIYIVQCRMSGGSAPVAGSAPVSSGWSVSVANYITLAITLLLH